MPDEISYTLRMQEYVEFVFNYFMTSKFSEFIELVNILITHNQQRLTRTDICGNVLPKISVMVFVFLLYSVIQSISFRSDRSTTANYTSQFLGVQYFIDLSIIQYATSIAPDPSSVSACFHCILVRLMMLLG